MDLRNELGLPIFLQGYAARVGCYSVPLAERGGCREIILPGAFASTRVDSAHARFSHMVEGRFAEGSLCSAWADELGLAVEIGPLPATHSAVWMARQVAGRQVAGMSISADLSHGDWETIGGERVFVVSKVPTLDEFGPTATPAYLDTGVWRSDAGALSPHLEALRTRWNRSSPLPTFSASPTSVVSAGQPGGDDADKARRTFAALRASTHKPDMLTRAQQNMHAMFAWRRSQGLA